MASGQTTYNASLNPTAIYEAALMYLREEVMMANLVSVFNDRQGLIPRTGSRWSSLGFRTVNTTDDVSAEQFARTAIGTLTPAIYADMVFIADEDLKTETVENLMGSAAETLGLSAADHIEDNLANTFSSFTGGTVGTAGSAITWAYFWAMRSQLAVASKKQRAAKFFVCHTYQWHVLANSAATAGVDVVQPRLVDQQLVTAFGLRQVDDVLIFPTSRVTIDSGTDAYAGMFNTEALGLDIRTAFNIRPQRDESRGGGGTELNAHLTYGYGVWDATQGIQGIFDAATPDGT